MTDKVIVVIAFICLYALIIVEDMRVDTKIKKLEEKIRKYFRYFR